MWEALKILDAADADHPEASSEVYVSPTVYNSLILVSFALRYSLDLSCGALFQDRDILAESCAEALGRQAGWMEQ